MSKGFGKPNKSKKRQELAVNFYVWNGVVYAINHGGLNNLIVPARLANQYQKYFDIIEAAIADLEDESNGKWVFTASKGWERFDFALEEMLEIAKFDLSIVESKTGISQNIK